MQGVGWVASTELGVDRVQGVAVWVGGHIYKGEWRQECRDCRGSYLQNWVVIGVQEAGGRLGEGYSIKLL